MKRRIVKKMIRKAEERNAPRMFNFLKSFKAESPEDFDPTLICVFFAYLLSLHLHLSDWNTKEKWIDGLLDGKLILRLPNKIFIKGEMVWGLTAEIGGKQWKEPFEVTAEISRNGEKLISYVIKFANDKTVAEKEIESGLYSQNSIIEIKNEKSRTVYKEEYSVPNEYSGDYKYVFQR